MVPTPLGAAAPADAAAGRMKALAQELPRVSTAYAAGPQDAATAAATAAAVATVDAEAQHAENAQLHEKLAVMDKKAKEMRAKALEEVKRREEAEAERDAALQNLQEMHLRYDKLEAGLVEAKAALAAAQQDVEALRRKVQDTRAERDSARLEAAEWRGKVEEGTRRTFNQEFYPADDLIPLVYSCRTVSMSDAPGGAPAEEDSAALQEAHQAACNLQDALWDTEKKLEQAAQVNKEQLEQAEAERDASIARLTSTTLNLGYASD